MLTLTCAPAVVAANDSFRSSQLQLLNGEFTMIFLSSSQRATHVSLAIGLALGLATLSGCGIGTRTVPNSTATTAVGTSGTIHGGLSPVTGATVTLYASGDSNGNSAGYGVGNALQTAVSDSSGSFQFAGGYTCPANQYAYVVATGGKTGSNAVNSNSILMAALGPCSGVSSSTFTLINELTTIAAGYALNNFMTVTGDAVHGYTVGIGAPATNNAAAGCVANAYYSGCTTTTAAGLKHAFINAEALVNTTNGQPNATTFAGAIVPVPFINTLGNVLQACVNSSGGGTDPTSGLPNVSFSAAGTTNDGTICGKLFAYTSYTRNGTPNETLVAAGNTLSAVQNLAKRPSGSATMFDSNCSSTAGTVNNAATCIYNLATPVGVYQTSMTAAPPDWMLGISYPKASLSTSSTNTFGSQTGPACGSTSAGNGLLYPTAVATDINANAVIFNADGSTPICGDIIVIASDGTSLGTSTINNATAGAVHVGVDAWGHALLPLRTGNGVLFYQYGAGGASDPNDASVPPRVTTVTSTGANMTPANTTSAFNASFVQVDGNGRVYVASNKTFQNTWGYLAPNTLSHTAPLYTATSFTNTTTSGITGATVDINNNAFGTKTTLPVGTAASATAFVSGNASNATSTNGQAIVTDTSNNAWLLTTNGTALGTSQTLVLKNPYTVTAGALAFGANATATSPTYAFPTNTSAAL